MYDVPREPVWNDTTETTQLLVLSEGLFNMNNSTLAKVNLQTGDIDFFFTGVRAESLADAEADRRNTNGQRVVAVCGTGGKANALACIGLDDLEILVYKSILFLLVNITCTRTLAKEL